MSDSNSTNIDGIFSVGEPSEYVGGHIAIGVVTLLQAAIPVTLYYAWMKPRLDMMSGNTWYADAWGAATYGGFITYIIPFFFWCLSFISDNTFAYLYVGMLIIFGGIFGSYISGTTYIYQMQAIKWFMPETELMDIDEIWWFFGAYLSSQLLFGFIGEHYLMDSIFYLLSSNIKDWCEDHPGVCQDYGVLKMKEE